MRRSTTIAAGLLLLIGVAGAAPAAASIPPKAYPSCAALNQDYPHGVGLAKAHDTVRGHTKPVTTFTRNDTVYKLNPRRDGDHDGVACEKR